MPFDAHVRRGHTITITLLILFGIVEVAISAWLVFHYNHHHNSSHGARSTAAYLLFCSLWTIFFSILFGLLFLFAASTGSMYTSVGAHMFIFFVTWLFWTAGAASITAALSGGLNCGHTNMPYCGQLNALEAFAWIEWVLTSWAILMLIWIGFHSLRRGDGFRSQLVTF